MTILPTIYSQMCPLMKCEHSVPCTLFNTFVPVPCLIFFKTSTHPLSRLGIIIYLDMDLFSESSSLSKIS